MECYPKDQVFLQDISLDWISYAAKLQRIQSLYN